MKQYVFTILITWLITYSITYALSQETTQEKLERENKAILETYAKEQRDCYDNATGSSIEISQKYDLCKLRPKPQLKTISWDWNSWSSGEVIKVNNAKATTGSVIPVAKRPENKIVSVECEWWEIEKVEWIEFHFTATDEETTLQAIKNAHVNKGSEHIGYHYVIKPDGEITNTRDEKCVAAADKWHKNNYRFIQVAFIWEDKPTDKQYDSILKLTILLQKKYNLSIDSVSAHNEWWPKNKKESLDYWYGSKEDFIKLIRSKYQISIYWKQSEELTYMWQAWWDIDFIGTMFQESRMKNNSIWDGGNSIWYCQIHKELQPWWHSHYKSLETMQERLNYCHELYTYAKWLKGGVGSRFHWFDAREKHIGNISIQ